MATHVIPALLCLPSTFIALLKMNLTFYHFIYISAKMTENLIEIDVLSQNITAIAVLIMVNLDTPVSGGIVLLIK